MNRTRRSFLTQSLAAAALAPALRAALDKPRFFSRFDARAQELLGRMTLEEKIGQMTQPDQMYLSDIEDIDKYHLGSVLSGGDSDPKSGNDLQSWTDMYDRHQARALKTRLKIPLVYGVDALHGHNNVIGAVVFPHNIGLGCTRDPKLVEQAARITALEVRATGMNWTFAPCVTVPQDIRWGRTYEGFSESPDVVRVLGEAAVRGYQNGGLNNPRGVLACAKHFAADGGTTFGTGMPKGKGGDRFPLDRGDTRLDEPTLRKLHLQGYLTAVAAGVGTIMPSYSSWNGEKCSGSKRLMQEILKDELGFEGFLISDYNALDELPGNRKQQTQRSINAGMDMVMVPEAYPAFFNTMLELVREDAIPITRIDDAVTRILKVKFAMGLMDSRRSQLADRGLQKHFGSAQHRAVARECVRRSVIVLKNENKALPLARSAKIHVAGQIADDIGSMCGGWTIKWQGDSGATTTGGTTILAAIRQAAGASNVTQSVDGNGAQGAALGVVVIGEKPYAEFFGDRTELRLAPEDIAAVKNVKSAGIPVVAVLVSGRPVPVDEILPYADAIVAAWLPGTEGAGVADVLFGTVKPTGKLAFTWPAAASTSYQIGDTGYKVQYPFGHGLSY